MAGGVDAASSPRSAPVLLPLCLIVGEGGPLPSSSFLLLLEGSPRAHDCAPLPWAAAVAEAYVGIEGAGGPAGRRGAHRKEGRDGIRWAHFQWREEEVPHRQPWVGGGLEGVGGGSTRWDGLRPLGRPVVGTPRREMLLQ